VAACFSIALSRRAVRGVFYTQDVPATGVVVLDLASRTALGFIKVHDARRFVLTPDGKTLYVLTNSFSRTPELSLTAIDTRTTASATVLQPIGLGPPRWSPWGGVFAPGGKTLYILSYDMSNRTGRYLAARMTPVDPATGTVGKPIVIPAGEDAIAFRP
jgi:DNA-binding beta-propeller fold protein YncE